mmetsp:Transcript_39163/g.37523  ORF Transcript_39163/g.37523 Transcript_39163/m.37523 type:complete len:81 (+) Transcript_39163:1022-1264(+)
MNFIHENYKKINLIEFNVVKKQRMRYFFKWRQAFLNRRKIMDGKADGLQTLKILMTGRKDLSVRKCLCKWRDFVQLRDLQ